VASLAATALAAAPVLAAPNPSGTGQPSQSCQDVGTGPPGLVSTTNGFATRAVNVYAGTPARNRSRTATRTPSRSTTWPASSSRST